MTGIDRAYNDQTYVSAWREINAARGNRDEVRQEIRGCMILIPRNPYVFSPDPNVTHAAHMLMDLAGEFRGRVLDVATGTGIIGIVAAKHGAQSVVMTDIHEPSLECARDNAEANGVSSIVEIIESDVMDQVSGKFDLILANLPVSDNYDHLSINRNDIARRFWQQAREHVTPNGRILATNASFGNVDYVRQYLQDQNIDHTEHNQKKFGVTWYVFESSGPGF